jgi:hypothetical protein
LDILKSNRKDNAYNFNKEIFIFMKLNKFSYGLIIGFLLAGSAAWGTDRILIEVDFPIIHYELDGQGLPNVNTKEVPNTIIYNGYSYVQTRWLAESLGKEVIWDGVNKRILFHSVKHIPAIIVTGEERSIELEEWINNSKSMELAQWRIIEGDMYILITRGEKRTGGYQVHIDDVKQYPDRLLVTIHYIDPLKGAPLIQSITYPYTLVKLENYSVQGSVVFQNMNE